MYKTLNGKLCTGSEMTTILTDCEAASNMRPLGVTSEYPEDNNILPLTPSHLIKGEAINPLPTEIYAHEENESRKDVRERDGKKEN